MIISNKVFEWNEQKNQVLKETRGITFDEITKAILSGGLIDRYLNPNQERYAQQEVFVVYYNNYIYVVPFVEDSLKYFLKTIIPNRKAKKKYQQFISEYEK